MFCENLYNAHSPAVWRLHVLILPLSHYTLVPTTRAGIKSWFFPFLSWSNTSPPFTPALSETTVPTPLASQRPPHWLAKCLGDQSQSAILINTEVDVSVWRLSLVVLSFLCCSPPPPLFAVFSPPSRQDSRLHSPADLLSSCVRKDGPRRESATCAIATPFSPHTPSRHTHTHQHSYSYIYNQPPQCFWKFGSCRQCVSFRPSPGVRARWPCECDPTRPNVRHWHWTSPPLNFVCVLLRRDPGSSLQNWTPTKRQKIYLHEIRAEWRSFARNFADDDGCVPPFPLTEADGLQRQLPPDPAAVLPHGRHAPSLPWLPAAQVVAPVGPPRLGRRLLRRSAGRPAGGRRRRGGRRHGRGRRARLHRPRGAQTPQGHPARGGRRRRRPQGDPRGKRPVGAVSQTWHRDGHHKVRPVSYHDFFIGLLILNPIICWCIIYCQFLRRDWNLKSACPGYFLFDVSNQLIIPLVSECEHFGCDFKPAEKCDKCCARFVGECWRDLRHRVPQVARSFWFSPSGTARVCSQRANFYCARKWVLLYQRISADI